MARKLKAYQTSLGFFDLAIAAPSMKAALEAWGAKSNLLHQGVAKETDGPEVVAAARPGVDRPRSRGTPPLRASAYDVFEGLPASAKRRRRVRQYGRVSSRFVRIACPR